MMPMATDVPSRYPPGPARQRRHGAAAVRPQIPPTNPDRIFMWSGRLIGLDHTIPQPCLREGDFVLDVLMLALVAAFFAAGLGYVLLCDRL
jgi:hypothetical protein